MSIVDDLNKRIEHGKASDRVLAKAMGQTVRTMDADTMTPDPTPDGKCLICGASGVVAGDICDLCFENARLYRDGKCPVCGTNVNVGEVICDGCFADAQWYRETH